jgi:tetratricopeptide (TPR) repeat protein
MSSCEALREEGDQLFLQKKYESAIDMYSRAIEADPQDKVALGNR